MNKRWFAFAVILFSCCVANPSVAGDQPTQAKVWRIFSVDPDGNNLQEWLPIQTTRAYGSIDVDVQDRRVYWPVVTELSNFGPLTPVTRANPIGGQIEEVFVAGDVQRLAVDGVRDKIFYVRGSDCTPCTGISRRDLDGSNPIGIVSDIYFTPVAADPVGQKVYWNEEGTIQVANYNGSGQQTLISSVGSSRSMAIDSAGHKLYWTSSAGAIRRVNLDGTGFEDLVFGLPDPLGIALDPENDRMWWTDYSEGTIVQATLDGSEMTTILTGLDEPLQLAYLPPDGIGDGKLYVVSDPEIISIPVPATSVWGAAGLAVLLVLLSTLALRRRAAIPRRP